MGLRLPSTKADYTISFVWHIVNPDNNDEGQEREDAAMAYDISPDTHRHQSKEMLLYNLSRGIQLLLSKSEKKLSKKRRKLKKGKRMITESLLQQLQV